MLMFSFGMLHFCLVQIDLMGTHAGKLQERNLYSQHKEYIFTGWDKDIIKQLQQRSKMLLSSAACHTLVSEVVKPKNSEVQSPILSTTIYNSKLS